MIASIYKIRYELSRPYGEREAESMTRILFEDGLKRSLTTERPLSDLEERKLHEMLNQIRRGVPIQYVVGNAHFYGLNLHVNPAVLIPRPETEELVDHILKRHKDNHVCILDIGTGSGCIALALKKSLPRAIVYGMDASKEALDVARYNGANIDLEVEWVQADMLNSESWHALPVADVIVSNPPYISEDEAGSMSNHVVQYEPHQALFVPQDDILLFYHALLQLAAEKLKPDGELWVECHENHAQQVAASFKKAGYKEVIIHQDMQGKERIVFGRRNF